MSFFSEKSFSQKMSLAKIMQSVDRTPRVEVLPVVERKQLTVKDCVGDVVRHWFTDRGKVRLILTVGMGEWERDNFIHQLKMRLPDVVVCAADDHFVTTDGQYKFDPKLLTTAHAKCQTKAYDALRAGKFVVVANKNCELQHIMEYSSSGSRLKFHESTLIIKFMPKSAAAAVALGIDNVKNIPTSVYSSAYESMQDLTITREHLPKLQAVMTVCE